MNLFPGGAIVTDGPGKGKGGGKVFSGKECVQNITVLIPAHAGSATGNLSKARAVTEISILLIPEMEFKVNLLLSRMLSLSFFMV